MRFFAVALVLILVVIASGGMSPPGTRMSSPEPSATAHPLPSVSTSAIPRAHSASPQQCAGMYPAETISASYVPAFCIGHDEPTVSYRSSVSGSGEDANFRFWLPADGATYPQADFYATVWFGGVVYDTNSTQGGSQGFLEFQFYPAPPMYTGPGSGSQDCLVDGSFNPVFTPGSNLWFACVIVWQLASSGAMVVEDAAFAGPLDIQGSTAIMVLHSGDQVFLNYSGVAKSTTLPWQLNVSDVTQHVAGNVPLKNGSLVLSPYYSTATSSSTLRWGASNPGAIAFAYEIAHSLNPAIPVTCGPGDGVCDSYWPGRWGTAGQMELELPVQGSGTARSYPTTLAFSSSQGGELAVNGSTCAAPSFSTSKNCMYPFYQYRSGFYSFTYGASLVANDTHDYGNEYEFPAAISGSGQYRANVEAAPWGTVHFTISPPTATVDFNRIGEVNPVPLTSRTAIGQYEEGPYWLNVSAPSCTSSSTFVYVKTSASLSLPLTLSCGGRPPPLTASASASPAFGTVTLKTLFSGTGGGGIPPLYYNWSLGDGTTSTLQSPVHNYSAAGTYVAQFTVTDSDHVSAAYANVTITVYANPSIASFSVTPSSILVNQSTTLAVTATGGTPPLRYGFAGLPSNCTSQNLASISCAPSVAGNYTIVALVTDGNGHAANLSATLTVTAVSVSTHSSQKSSGFSLTELELFGILGGILVVVAVAVALSRRSRNPPA